MGALLLGVTGISHDEIMAAGIDKRNRALEKYTVALKIWKS